MKKLLLLFCQLFFLSLSAQTDILGGIFGKEEAEFNLSVQTTENEGVVDLTFYYTHSKVDALEISFWIMDLGTNFISSGEKEMVKGLQEIGNRSEKVVTIEGLQENHFYTIGIDYRSPRGISRKFMSKVLMDGYHYKGQATAPTVNEEIDTPMTELEKPREVNAQQPCFNPSYSLRVEPAGYCQNFDKPAVLIQCENCQGKEWEFSVETRTAFGDWEPVRADGKRQPASGVSLRTEPLCTLPDGEYEVRVLAWGMNCPTPVMESVGTPITIGNLGITGSNELPGENKAIETEAVQSIPDSCSVAYEAVIDGNFIKGTLELPFNSPCSDFEPYVKVRYVHPSYRDITSEPILLLPGGRVPFSIELDERDLERSIHTLQGITYLGEGNGVEDILINTFWMRPSNPYAYAEEEPVTDNAMNMETKGGEEEFESSLADEQSIEEVSVTAFDPNCTQIQDLQLVYGSGRSKKPLFVSWLSPRCCQEDGCDYSVWAGPAPDQLRLLVKGSKPGAVVKELMQNARASDGYYEVVVNTRNGNRKAAYVPGEGPIYGIEEIANYHDLLNPMEEEVVVKLETYDTYPKPTLALKEFRSCRIFRPTTLSTDNMVEPGTIVNISYDFSEKGYQYTLYMQPAGSAEWYVAPETKELQGTANFEFTAKPKHTGKYLILAYNPSITWGCLSLPVSEAVELKVGKNK